MTKAAEKTEDQIAAPEAGGSLTDAAKEVRSMLGDLWIPSIYLHSILSSRTRSVSIGDLKRPSKIEVRHTLFGVELKVGRKRIACPDMASARYLGVFARLTCPLVAIPYDITKVKALADLLESSFETMVSVVQRVGTERGARFRSRLRRAVLKEARKEIAEAGPGPVKPGFDQPTRRRNG